MRQLPRLLLIADEHRERPGALAAAVAAGAPFVQIRDKDFDDAAVEYRLRIVREAISQGQSPSIAVQPDTGRCRDRNNQGTERAVVGERVYTPQASRPCADQPHTVGPTEPTPAVEHASASSPGTGCLLSINGRPAMARSHSMGLHLPATHEAVAREGIVLLGRSAHDEEGIRRAVAEGVDYLIVGTVFPSASKPGREPLGLDGLARLVALATPLPVFAIGGITPARVASVLATRAHGVAVCSAVLDAGDPAAATRRFLSELYR